MRPGCITGMVLVVALPCARAQSYEVWHVDGSDSSFNLGSAAIDRFDDVDADGVADLLVGSPQNQGYGTITLLSGANGATLWTIVNGSFHVGLGYRLATLGDVDGDGTSDLASLTVDAIGYVYSGATQAYLYSFSVASNWSVVAAIADVDGDGFRDFAVGNPQGKRQLGTVDVRSGATGALVQTLDGESGLQQFGRTVRGVGYVDADGIDDFMVGAQHSYAGSNNGKVWAYSGATLHRIWRRTGDPGDALGWDFAPVGDLDQDGYADVAVSAVAANGGIGKLVIYSGFQATVLREIAGDAGGFFGWSLHPAGDVLGDGDATSKLLVTGSIGSPGDATTGRVDAVDAASGVILARIEGAPGEMFSNAAIGLGDVDADGLADMSVTSPAYHPSSYYYWGRVTTFGWRFAPRVESVTPTRGPHDATTTVTVNGAWFDPASSLAVAFGGVAATNVQVIDHRTLTCDTPTGLIGPADVSVTTDLGAGTLAAGFAFTPALELEGDFRPGGSGVAKCLVDPGDSLLGIAGLPPPVTIHVAPFDGDLCISPFVVLFLVTGNPNDEFDLAIDVPNDPSLSGLDVLLQALVGPQLGGRGKRGAWTNCPTLHIQ